MRFQDRAEAGRALASRLVHYAGRGDVLTLGLPRGGVPVGYAVAAEIRSPLDVFVVRKVGVPGREELAMGAVASGGKVVRNEDVIGFLDIPDDVFNLVAQQEFAEIARREAEYRAGRPAPDVCGRIVILVDDGLATGSTMRAAVEALRSAGPQRLVVAVPVASSAAADEFRALVEEFVAVMEPDQLDGVGRWYEDFEQTSDEEVRRLLREAVRP